MNFWLADGFFGGAGQGGRQIIELFVAFGLTALIGAEREIQGKSAGLRTQTIVGTAAALILLVSKYGFGDVLSPGTVILLDPSRVAAQIVTGIGFLGAGIIITRRGAIRLHVTYEDGRGVLRQLLQACERRDWQLAELAADAPDEPLGAPAGQVGVTMTLSGAGILSATTVLAAIDGVSSIRQLEEDPD
jgi:putative Mg2+ transporter-C (MgtC) family protein